MPTDPNQNTNGIGSINLPTAQQPSQAVGNSWAGPGNVYNPYFDPANNGGQDQTGGKFNRTQGLAYGNMFGQSQGMQNYFNQAAAGYNQAAPTIGDVSQLNAAGNYYAGLMQGDGGYAQNQFRQSQDQSIAAQMAMANSARGGAAAQAGAQRAATQGAGAQMATAANQAGQIASQEEQAGAQGMAGIGQAELQRGSANAQLQQANQAQINQMQTALYGMGEQEQGLSLSEQQAYMANLLAAEGIQTQQSQFNTQLGTQIAGAGLQAGGALIGAAASDENLKTDIQPQGIGSAYKPNYTQSLSPAAQAAQPTAPSPGTSAGIGAATGALSGAAAGGIPGAGAGAGLGAAQSGLHAMGPAASATPAEKEQEKTASVAGQAAAGAGMGALSGSALGPIGAGVGALAGGIAGALKGLL